MADQKITELDALTEAAADDLLAIVDDPGGTPVTKKITVANLQEAIGGIALSAGRPGSVAENDVWIDTQLMAMFARLAGADRLMLPGRTRYGQWAAMGGGAVTNTAVGFLAAFDGSVTAVSLDADGPRVAYRSGATANDRAGLRSTAAVWRRAFNPLMIVRFKLPAITTVRFFAGFSNASQTVIVNADDPGGHHAGIQFSTSREDTNFQFMTKDNSTQGVSDSGVEADTGTHTFMMAMDGDRVVFALDEAAQVVRTANLPGADTDLLGFCILQTLDEVARDMEIAHVQAYWSV